MAILAEIIKICERYLSGEMNVKAFESGFDSIVFRHEAELMAQEQVFQHIEAIRSAMDCFEPIEAARATDSSLIDEEQLRQCVRLNAMAMNSGK